MIYYTSDLHIGHKNALRFDDRPFADVDEMEREMIRLWNETVSPNDEVYVLGDVFYRYKGSKADFLYKLCGRLRLVTGNHDDGLLSDEQALSRFESVDMMKTVNDSGRMVVLCHFPIAEWDKKHRSSYHVYGHIHAQLRSSAYYMLAQERAFNAGCMINGYKPCTLEELEKNKRLFIEKNGISEQVLIRN